MPRTRLITIAVAVVAVGALGAAACGDDDGADVRNIGGDCGGSASASASGGSASASGGSASGGSGSGACPSGSGSSSGGGRGRGSGEDVGGSATDNPLVQDALTAYRTYVDEQVDATIAATTSLTDTVRAGDLEAAKTAYAPSRQGRERIVAAGAVRVLGQLGVELGG